MKGTMRKYFLSTYKLPLGVIAVGLVFFMLYYNCQNNSFKNDDASANANPFKNDDASANTNSISNPVKLKVRSEDEILNSSSTAMDDPELIQIIKDKFLRPPSKLPYYLKDSNKTDYSQLRDSTMFDELFNHKRQGFFIECGALDGEFLSGSLFFEKSRDWNGLLVEAGPGAFGSLTIKNRKAYSIMACAAVYPHPHKVKYANQGTRGQIISPEEEPKLKPDVKKSLVDAQCFPFYSMLLAVGNPTVDLFILDTEGAETRILKTIPFDKVDIKYFYIEYNNDKENKDSIDEVLTKNGYEFMKYFSFNLIYRKK